MKRKLNGVLALSSVACAAALTFAQGNIDEGSIFCSCAQGSLFDTALPMSHPINRCAAQQSDGVSWSSWFRGASGSSQFHYLDLLELLSRQTEDNNVKPQRS